MVSSRMGSLKVGELFQNPVRVYCMTREDFENIKNWCIDNCAGIWYFPNPFYDGMPQTWYFDSVEDAVIFSLTWKRYD